MSAAKRAALKKASTVKQAEFVDQMRQAELSEADADPKPRSDFKQP